MQSLLISDMQMDAVRLGARSLVVDGRHPDLDLGKLMLERAAGRPESMIVSLRRIILCSLSDVPQADIWACGGQAWKETAALSLPEREVTVLEIRQPA